MGTNTGHGAILNFIKANEERAQAMITKAISFIEDVPLQSCKSATSDTLDGWYYRSSLVFAATEHAFWSSDYAKKIRKRFGRIFKSPEEHISDMLAAHKDAVAQLLLDETEEWRSGKHVVDDEDMIEGSSLQPEPVQRGLPPIGNFALSPRKIMHNGATVTPTGRGARSPRVGSPGKGMPSIANFPMSPKLRPSRSPAR